MFTFSLSTIITILYLILSIFLIIFNIILFCKINKIFKQIQDNHKKIIEKEDDIYSDILHEIAEFSNSLTSLSESVSSHPQETTKRFPTPEEETNITNTIRDQIATEISLAAGLRAPYKDSLNEIIFRVIETYPDINVEYIVRKTISIVETYSKS